MHSCPSPPLGWANTHRASGIIKFAKSHWSKQVMWQNQHQDGMRPHAGIETRSASPPEIYHSALLGRNVELREPPGKWTTRTKKDSRLRMERTYAMCICDLRFWPYCKMAIILRHYFNVSGENKIFPLLASHVTDSSIGLLWETLIWVYEQFHVLYSPHHLAKIFVYSKNSQHVQNEFIPNYPRAEKWKKWPKVTQLVKGSKGIRMQTFEFVLSLQNSDAQK